MKVNWFNIDKNTMKKILTTCLSDICIFTENKDNRHDRLIFIELSKLFKILKIGNFCKDCNEQYWKCDCDYCKNCDFGFCVCNYLNNTKKQIEKLIFYFIYVNYSNKLIDELQYDINRNFGYKFEKCKKNLVNKLENLKIYENKLV